MLDASRMTDIPPQIFANQEDQPSWIIEDILISSLKLPDLKQKYGQFQLASDLRSVPRPVLFIRFLTSYCIDCTMVTSSHYFRIATSIGPLAHQQSFVMRHDRQVNGGSKAFLSDHDHEVLIFPKISSSIVSRRVHFNRRFNFARQASSPLRKPPRLIYLS